ncbi:MAG TPA: DNA gyrase inhibitor YacG [Stellaceae bacterium]|nr:DNA gyrase inhibitor YacG [Stellaceae bacterium]
MADDSLLSPHGPPCPICGKPAMAGHRPFCSKRCRNIDLGRWLRGVYRVETEEGPEDDSADAGGQP